MMVIQNQRLKITRILSQNHMGKETIHDIEQEEVVIPMGMISGNKITNGNRK
jgi:hypothetical protein